MSEVRPLRAYAEVALGRQRSPAHDTGPHMIPYLRAANVKDGALDLSDVKEMNFDPKEQRIFSLRAGDVLVTEGSGSLGAVGASAVWQSEIEGTVCFQNALLRLRPRPSTDPRFLGWWCRYAFADGVFASVATGANIFHVSADRVRSLPMTYLPIARQRAIADFLDAETVRIDALIAKKRRLIELLDARQAALFPDALSRRGFDFPVRVDTDLRHLGKPMGWLVMHLSVALERLTNGFVGPTRDLLVDKGVRYIQSLHIKNGGIDFGRRPFFVPEAWHRQRPRVHLREGDVLIVQTGDIGQVAVVPPGFGEASCHALQIARVRQEVVSGPFLGAYLRAPFGHHSLLSRATGALHPHLEGGIRDVQIVVPPLREQAEVLEELAEASAHLDVTRQRIVDQLALLREHRQALITAAVTGELAMPGVAA